jgi:hypothetical protein
MGWYVQSTRALAKILLVDESAIRRAERNGRISREPDGRWSLWGVIDSWRDESHWFPGRAPPWLDLSRGITPLMEHQLIARAEAVGAELVDDARTCPGDRPPGASGGRALPPAAGAAADRVSTRRLSRAQVHGINGRPSRRPAPVPAFRSASPGVSPRLSDHGQSSVLRTT